MRPFEEIVTDYGPMVLRVCRAVVGPADAEDAWSETFLAALKAYPKLDEDANVEAWLVTIAHRKAIDAARASARRPVATGDLPDRPTTRGRPEDWDGDLWDALRRLPDRQRAAVAYHHLAGLPYQEIASIIGGTADAARRAAADGIKNLRQRYPRAEQRDDHAPAEEREASARAGKHPEGYARARHDNRPEKDTRAQKDTVEGDAR